jgi:radical SAM protein with 4Fe4S-binding SPASM domain
MHHQDIVFESSGRSLRPAGDSGDRGFFFSTRSHLEAGLYIARFQVLLPRQTPPDAFLAFEVVVWDGDTPSFAGRSERRWDDELARASDHILLVFPIDHATEVEYRCFASDGCGSVHLRALKVKRADRGHVEDWSYTHGTSAWPLDHLRNVIIGNSSVCNARCPHCPTSLNDNGSIPQKIMPLDLHEKLVRGLVECGLPIRGQLAYGLFAEPFLDPTLLAKTKAVREALPKQRVVVNTNGGPFNPRVHEPLVETVTAVSVHIEAHDPVLYEALMPPLTASRTFPRLAEIARLWQKRAKLAVPVHARNLDQPKRLEEWWRSLGGGEVIPLQYSNRCSWSPASASLLLWPAPGDCHQEVVEDLIVDFDGKVLTCCHDFSRRNEIGDLRLEEVSALMANDARREVFDALGQQEWNRFESCRDCLVSDVPLMQAALAEAAE